MKIMTSREFNQDTGGAKRAAEKGPVFITNRGKPAWVLMSHAEYERLTRQEPSLAEALAMPGIADVDLESVLPRRRDFPRAADLD